MEWEDLPSPGVTSASLQAGSGRAEREEQSVYTHKVLNVVEPSSHLQMQASM